MNEAKPGRSKCECQTPEKNGEIKHSGKLVSFSTKNLFLGNKWKVIVCWHHRKWYRGWKNAKEIKEAQ